MTDILKFGVRVSMPANDPLAAAHLLGESWSSERWFATQQERDAVIADMQKQPNYYRKGDQPSIILEKISR